MQESAKAHIFKRFKTKKMNNEPQVKTRLAWLMEYPEPYRTQAILNTELHGRSDSYEEYPLSEVVAGSVALQGFRWEKSQEGKAYWENFYARRHMEPTKLYRYPWHEAPEWAVFAATDEDGEAFWFGAEIHGYDFFTPKDESIPGQFDAADWKNSVEMRPAEFQKQPNTTT